jgi:hypothetical protein
MTKMLKYLFEIETYTKNFSMKQLNQESEEVLLVCELFSYQS